MPRGRAPLPPFFKTCAEDGCDVKTEVHQWAAKHAQSEGWFFQRDGRIWCPEHNPPWVEEWRAKQAGK